jgi:hypothetical protein
MPCVPSRCRKNMNIRAPRGFIYLMSTYRSRFERRFLNSVTLTCCPGSVTSQCSTIRRSDLSALAMNVSVTLPNMYASVGAELASHERCSGAIAIPESNTNPVHRVKMKYRSCNLVINDMLTSKTRPLIDYDFASLIAGQAWNEDVSAPTCPIGCS